MLYFLVVHFNQRLIRLWRKPKNKESPLKKITAAVFVAALICGARIPAYAEPAGQSEEEFQAGRLWHFAALPVWFPVWSTIHEGSHALTATAFGYTGCVIHPYPHANEETRNFGDFHCNAISPKGGGALMGAGRPEILKASGARWGVGRKDRLQI